MEFDACAVLREDDVKALEDHCFFTLDMDEIVPSPAKCETPELFSSNPSLLCAACFFRSYNCARFLLSQFADIEYRDKLGRQPILFAVAGGSLQIIQILLENGSSLESTDNLGNGLVHYIVTYKRKSLLVWFAFTNTLSLSPRNNRKVTPLHMAVNAQLTDFVRMLCENGADIDAQTDRGATPLHYASSKRCMETVEILHEYGAKLSVKDNGGVCFVLICKHITGLGLWAGRISSDIWSTTGLR